jgi:hypothetical protein
LRVYPGADSEFTLYDDDGRSPGYRDDGSNANATWIRCRWDDSSRKLIVEPDRRMRRWIGGVREFRVELHGGGATSKRIDFRGKRLEVSL